MSNEIALQNFQDSLDTQMRRAELMSKANMIPDKFKGQPANVLVAQEIATSMGESTWVVMSEPVSYTHLTLPTIAAECRSRWSPYH